VQSCMQQTAMATKSLKILTVLLSFLSGTLLHVRSKSLQKAMLFMYAMHRTYGYMHLHLLAGRVFFPGVINLQEFQDCDRQGFALPSEKAPHYTKQA
jgi:hypothetical protein